MPVAIITPATPDARVPTATDTALMARIAARGTSTLITQASLSTIAYVLKDLTAGTTITSGSLTVSAVVFDSLQQLDPAWTRDDASTPTPDGVWGYNFRQVVAAANISSQDHHYESRVTFTFTDGTVLVQPFRWWTV